MTPSTRTKTHIITVSFTFAVEVDERVTTSDVESAVRVLTTTSDGRQPFSTEIFQDAAGRLVQSFLEWVRDNFTQRMAVKYNMQWYRIQKFFAPACTQLNVGMDANVRFAWDGVSVWPESYRAGGDCLCMCGREYRKHPLGGPLGSDGPFLNVLCNGSLVKL